MYKIVNMLKELDINDWINLTLFFGTLAFLYVALITA